MLNPKSNWPPTQTNSPVTSPASSPPSGFSPLPLGYDQPRPPQGPPRYPSSLCSHEVGKDSLKCSTCSKWVHFTCSSLTRAHFRKTHQQASPRPVSPVPPPTTPPPPTCLDIMDSFIPLPSHTPLFNNYPLSAFTISSTPPPPTSTQPINNSPPHPQ